MYTKKQFMDFGIRVDRKIEAASIGYGILGQELGKGQILDRGFLRLVGDINNEGFPFAWIGMRKKRVGI